MRDFIKKLRLFSSLPREMQYKIIQELDNKDSVSMEDFSQLVTKYVFAFTSNA